MGEGRDDRDVIIQLAKRLGLTKAFPWKDFGVFLDDMLANKGIDLISLPTKEACREYNRRSQARKVAAALHLTC